MVTVRLRPELLALRAWAAWPGCAQGVPPGGSGGNFSGGPSSRGCSQGPAPLAPSARLLPSVTAALLYLRVLSLKGRGLSTPRAFREHRDTCPEPQVRGGAASLSPAGVVAALYVAIARPTPRAPAP